MTRRAALIVLDGLGVGAAHDTDAWGDQGSATLGNVVRRSPGLQLPNLIALGLGHCGDTGLPKVAQPLAAPWRCILPLTSALRIASGVIARSVLRDGAPESASEWQDAHSRS